MAKTSPSGAPRKNLEALAKKFFFFFSDHPLPNFSDPSLRGLWGHFLLCVHIKSSSPAFNFDSVSCKYERRVRFSNADDKLTSAIDFNSVYILNKRGRGQSCSSPLAASRGWISQEYHRRNTVGLLILITSQEMLKFIWLYFFIDI